MCLARADHHRYGKVLASCSFGGSSGENVLVSWVALRVTGVVGSVLTAFLPVLEAAVLRWTVGVRPLRRAVACGRIAVLTRWWRIALLAVALVVRWVSLLLWWIVVWSTALSLVVVVLGRVVLVAGSGGGVGWWVLIVWVRHSVCVRGVLLLVVKNGCGSGLRLMRSGNKKMGVRQDKK